MNRGFFKELFALLGTYNVCFSDFVRFVPHWKDKEHIIIAYISGKNIEYQHSKDKWGAGNQLFFSFNEPVSQYRIAKEIVKFEHNGKTYSIDLDKARELGIIKE